MTGEPVGLVGAGRLGAAVARRLLSRGWALRVYNRDARKLEPLRALGAGTAASPAEVAEHCRTVLVCVTDGAAVASVCTGPGGVVDGAREGTVVVDLTTTGPRVAVELHSRLRAAGIDYVECPVSGGPDGAEAGTLTALLAGDAGAAGSIDALVGAFASDRRYLGAPGRAQFAKVVNNALESVNLAAAAEVAGLAAAGGLELEELRWVLSHARGGSTYAHVLLDYLTGRSAGSGASVAIRRKDLRLALDSAPDAAAAPLLHCTDEVLARSEQHSGADADQCACARLYLGDRAVGGEGVTG